MKKIVILNFSPRKNGNCAAISNVIKQFHSNANICAYHVGSEISPCSGCDYECLRPDVKCPGAGQMAAWMDETIQADYIYYIVPNFCGFPCAAYFAFNERTVGYFDRDRAKLGQFMQIPKKFIVVSNTESQTFYDAMRQQSQQPEILYLKTSKYKKVSIAGDLMDSEDARADLLAFLTEL